MVCHRSALPDPDVTEVDGLRMTMPARALVEVACSARYEVVVVLFDAAVRQGLVVPDELAEMARRLRNWPGYPTARAATDFADGRSESVGESRLRLLMANQGLPKPELQVELHDVDGQLIGRVDFLVPTRGHGTTPGVVVEFDGEFKYAGDQGSNVVVAEKWREDRIRERGYPVVRVGWSDLDQPTRTAERIRAALGRAEAA